MRLGAVLLAAFAFGVFAAWAKGQGTGGISGVRATLGNVSTPWVLVGFFAGAQTTQLGRGALLGLLATAVALVGFCIFTTLVENLGGHGFVGDLRLELSGNRAYFEGGILTGPLFGALGAKLRQHESRQQQHGRERRSTGRTALLVGALLIAEPLGMVVLGAVKGHVLARATGLPLGARIIPGWGLNGSSGSTSWAIYGIEFLLGIAVVAWSLRNRLTERLR